VRQAINFAVDREGITAAVGGEYADPLQQIITPGRPGFDEDLDETYRHDPEEARALLEEAGWGDGFELQVTCVTLIAASCKIAEAVASDLDEVGITVRIDELTGEVQAFDDKLRSGQTPAAVQGHGGDTDRVFARLGMPTESPTSANPFQSSDEELAAIYDEAVRTSDPDEQDELWKQASARMQELGWFVPLYVGRNLFYVSPKVQGFEVSDANPVYTPVDPFDGSSTWYLG
jgi:peptide/nickel transport system substrate-binding protein